MEMTFISKRYFKIYVKKLIFLNYHKKLSFKNADCMKF